MAAPALTDLNQRSPGPATGAWRRAALLVLLTWSAPLWATEESSSPDSTIDVIKLPTCTCCATWITYLERNGFVVHASDVTDLAPARQRFGVPEAIAGCHTASIGGYVIDGHVSADEIRQLLRDRPAIKGLVVTGMPPGSPGMEAPSAGPYDTLALQNDGTTRVFATHPFVPEEGEAAVEPQASEPVTPLPERENVMAPSDIPSSRADSQ